MPTQHAKILAHCIFSPSHGITQREALLDYSIQSLTSRMSELKRLGWKFREERCRHPVTRQRYTRYIMEE